MKLTQCVLLQYSTAVEGMNICVLTHFTTYSSATREKDSSSQTYYSRSDLLEGYCSTPQVNQNYACKVPNCTVPVLASHTYNIIGYMVYNVKLIGCSSAIGMYCSCTMADTGFGVATDRCLIKVQSFP